MRPFLPALALLALGSSALAAPKPSATADFQPEFAYTYASGSSVDLRLANRAGDKAILVHRSTSGIGLFDVSIEGPNRIAYRSGTGFFMQSWLENPLRVTAPDPIYTGPGIVEGVDFSPDGSELAFATLGDDSRIFIYDVGSESLSSVLQRYSVFQVRWDPNFRVLYFTGKLRDSPDPTRVHMLDLRVADLPATLPDERVTPLFTPASSLLIFDLSHKPVAAEDTRILIHGLDEISLWRTDGFRDRILFPGNNAHFNCGNDAIVHRTAGSRRITTRISDLAGNFETWSSDPNIHRTDWIPQVPCL